MLQAIILNKMKYRDGFSNIYLPIFVHVSFYKKLSVVAKGGLVIESSGVRENSQWAGAVLGCCRFCPFRRRVVLYRCR